MLRKHETLGKLRPKQIIETILDNNKVIVLQYAHLLQKGFIMKEAILFTAHSELNDENANIRNHMQAVEDLSRAGVKFKVIFRFEGANVQQWFVLENDYTADRVARSHVHITYGFNFFTLDDFVKGEKRIATIPVHDGLLEKEWTQTDKFSAKGDNHIYFFDATTQKYFVFRDLK